MALKPSFNWRSTLDFITTLRPEVLLLLMLVAMGLRHLPSSKMQQDKICMNIYKPMYNFTDDYCLRLSEIKPEEDTYKLKNVIITTEANYNLYVMMLMTIPSIFFSPFFGPWCDKYSKGRKILMLSTTIAGFAENLVSLYLSINFAADYRLIVLIGIPQAMVGGFIATYTAVFSYIAFTTTKEERAFRFMIVEVVLFISHPIASVLGPILLDFPMSMYDFLGSFITINNGQLHNYPLVFIVNTVLAVMAFVFTLLFVDERKAIIKLRKTNPNISLPKPDDPNRNPVALLFELKNLKEILKTATKKRPDNGRLVIWLVTLAIVVNLLAHIGPMIIMFQFSQRVYLWDYKFYGIASALSYIVNAAGTVVAITIFTKMMKVGDIQLTIIGMISYFVSMVLRGSIQNPTGFILSTLAGSIGGISSVGTRSICSKLVPKDEFGKLFSLVSILDTFAPFMSQIFFTAVFTATISWFPGLVFEATALLLFIPLTLMAIAGRYYNDNASLDDDGNRINDESSQKNNNQAADVRQQVATLTNEQDLKKISANSPMETKF